MKKLSLAVMAALLAACQNNPPLQNDARYIRMARVVAVHVYSEDERREAAKAPPRARASSPEVSVGIGFGTSFGGLGVGVGGIISPVNKREMPPQPALGADRYTVEPLGSKEKLEVESYGKYKVGDCVKLFSGHPTEYARLFDLQPGETCTAGKPAAKESKKAEKP